MLLALLLALAQGLAVLHLHTDVIVPADRADQSWSADAISQDHGAGADIDEQAADAGPCGLCLLAAGSGAPPSPPTYGVPGAPSQASLFVIPASEPRSTSLNLRQAPRGPPLPA